jgi:hypothetical protein
MKFTKDDKLAYMNYLSNEIRNTSEETETIFTNHYIHNLYKDLTDMKLNLNK